MQHYFASIIDNKIVLSKQDEHHLVNVRRGQIGEEIELVIEGITKRAIIASLKPLEFTLLDNATSREPNINLIIAFGLLKGKDDDLLIEHCTQVGVNVFIPFLSERTIVLPKQNDGRIIRLRKLAYESSCQCRRSIIPEVKDYCNYNDVLNVKADHKFIAYENAKLEDNLLNYVSKIKKGETVLVLIGPEGGFTPLEVDKALSRGFRLISLGGRILKAEMASIMASCLIISQMEK